jgi:hypothetical protein
MHYAFIFIVSCGLLSSWAQDPPPMAEPYGYEPPMSASLSPAFTSVNEGSYAVATFTLFDKDTWRNPSTGATFTMMSVPTVEAVNIRSSTGIPLCTQSGQDPNTGITTVACSRLAKQVSATTVFVDSFIVVDYGSPTVLRDPGFISLEQQVEIKNVP